MCCLESAKDILKKYWGYNSFREQQEEIINAIIERKDAFVLMPTGGGKSMCYQLPALMLDGICIVVSPLIALMKDQIDQLRKREIKALYIHSGMLFREVENVLQNCIYGDYKFLYVSPERLKTQAFTNAFQNMNVSFVAVDEAHCVSQWGYDFRPEYLEIAALKELKDNLKFIALTATATQNIVDDICENLGINGCEIFKTSFERKNLSFVVRKTESKYNEVKNIVKKLNGSGIIYAPTRRDVVKISDELQKNNISANFYHAGLPTKERTERQQKWIENKIKIIVCTNAFGMGIDKPNVEFVIHFRSPENPEAYYQEAGRAGRNGSRAYAILLYHETDLKELKIEESEKFPPIEFIRNIYRDIFLHLSIPYSGGQFQSFDFDLISFSKKYNHPLNKVLSTLKMLEKLGFMRFSESVYMPSKLMLTSSHEEAIEMQSSNKILATIIRMYGGIFDFYSTIHEDDIARKSMVTEVEVKSYLSKLVSSNMADYIPQKEKPYIYFPSSRIKEDKLNIDNKLYQKLKSKSRERLEFVTQYITQKSECRSIMLRSYFGDSSQNQCGICDLCIAKNKKSFSTEKYNQYRNFIARKVNGNKTSIDELTRGLTPAQKNEMVYVLRNMTDNKELQIENGNYLLREN